ncbi:MAG TPA: ABC transporter substrate-binding protein, partial [Candidatus Aciduliprofundum boonei]|nr:ABC transporter substrate-binding protein [Candidatus Aciduliprofundum boonei]
MRAKIRAGVLLIFLLLVSLDIIPVSVKAYSGEKIHIVATLQIFATLAEKVGGEMVSVDYIVPQGMDIHSYSLKYEDVKKLEKGDLIILASSEFFSLDNSILQKFQNKEILDFSDYNATIYSLDGIKRNLHGYWLYPKNALNIARAIEKKLEKINPANSGYYKDNLINFENELNKAITTLNALQRECNLQNSTALLAVPGTYYIVKAMEIKIEGSILKGPNQFIGNEEIEEIKEKIKRGEIDFIVNAYGLEYS